MANFNYDKFINILRFIFCSYYFSQQFNYYLNMKWNRLTISEWLINYQGGFVRRGLLGELFFQISIKLNIEIRVIIVIFQIFSQSISYCFMFF